MKTIQKRADELKPGDVMIFGSVQYLVVSMGEQAGKCLVHMAPIAEDGGTPMWLEFDQSRMLMIEAPAITSALTPAQEHAEELLDVARRAAKLFEAHNRASEFVDEVNGLLAKIDPPKAPTYEEALAALAQLLSATPSHAEAAIDNGRAILDRARRAQVLHD